MIKEINKDQLVKMALNLKENEIIDFAMYVEDEELCGWSAIQKINWLDNNLVLIGGYHNESDSCDITYQEDAEIRDNIKWLIYNYFEMNELDTVYIEVEDQTKG